MHFRKAQKEGERFIDCSNAMSVGTALVPDRGGGVEEAGVQGPRIVVVSDSRPTRESLRLVLQGSYDVVAMTTVEARQQRHSLEAANLLISDCAPQQIAA
ncbi:MAG TPA: hypothetical protein VEB21_12985, partial [Terriglobales bacterium]|nr:hypothetical protein [Terriglobales bacterium]